MRTLKRLLQTISFSLFPLYFLSCSCTPENSQEPKVVQNIFVDAKVDPYQVSNFQEEFNYFVPKLLDGYQTFSAENYEFTTTKREELYPLELFDSKVAESIKTLAKESDQPLFADAKSRNFSLPKLNKEGKIKNIYLSLLLPKGIPAPSLSQPYESGVARILPNSKYLDLAKRSFALSFYNKAQESIQGSVWILDFKPSEDGSYPNHFFFATNAHVWAAFTHKNNLETPYKEFYNPAKENQLITLTKIKNSKLAVGKKYPTTHSKEDFEEIFIDPTLAKVRTIFMGLDFLKSSPSEWTDSPHFKDAQEMVDLAIFEVVFSPESLEEYTQRNNLSFEEALREITGDYANLEDSKRFRPLPSSEVFKDPISWPKKDFYALGYSSSKFDDFIDPLSESHLYQNRNSTRSFFVNKPKELFDQSRDKEGWREGGDLSASRSYRSFMHKPGMLDITIVAPKLATPTSNFFDMQTSEGANRRFFHYGLTFALDSAALPPGASGGIVINSDYKVVGPFEAADATASVGLVAALNSEGYDYKGYYGKYNLEPYDLIYGGFENQKFSYKDALRELYGPDFVTDIFPKGLK